ncbi:colicin-like pore-forming protein [Serratia ureilytica]|uniref:colicin-like pore-forming protein n=1 Tax=Serratia ureilytica TaxID=300181 RepID=UPI0039B4E745
MSYIDSNGQPHIVITGGPDSKPTGVNWGGGSGKGNGGNNTPSGGRTLNSVPGFSNVADGGQLEGDNRDKHLYYAKVESYVYSVTVDRAGNIKDTLLYSRPRTNDGDTRVSWAKGEDYRKGVARQQVANYLNAEKDSLTEVSGIIADAGEKMANHIGGQYKNYANNIANNLRNFQGKTIRSYNEALASLNNIMSNPSMKVKAGDKQSLINAMKSVNANDMAGRFAAFGKFFKAADLALKVDKIRDKAIEGYNTGNWGPLAYEVEAMVLSGMAGAAALGLVTGVLSLLGLSALATSALTIAAAAMIAYGVSYIDAALAEKFNNEVVRPAN